MVNDEFVGQAKANIHTLFKQQEEINNKLNKLEDGQHDLKEITTILKLQQQQNADHTQTLVKINENLGNLNSTVQTLQSDMDNVKNQVVSIQESGKLDIHKFMKEFLYKVLPSVIGTLIVAYFLWKFHWS